MNELPEKGKWYILKLDYDGRTLVGSRLILGGLNGPPMVRPDDDQVYDVLFWSPKLVHIKFHDNKDDWVYVHQSLVR